jgi:hypothetical protein
MMAMNLEIVSHFLLGAIRSSSYIQHEVAADHSKGLDELAMHPGA